MVPKLCLCSYMSVMSRPIVIIRFSRYDPNVKLGKKKLRCGNTDSDCVCLQCGGLSGFVNSFIGEMYAIMRANVAALGGNALVSFSLRECILLDNPHKNQVRGTSDLRMC